MPVRISTVNYFLWAAALLLLPVEFLLCGAVAAVIHELFHYCALRAFGLRIYGIHVTALGAVMETEPLSRGQEVISALAGPLGSFLLMLFAKSMPLLALCGFVQGAFNLIPVYPYDGGRALRALLQWCCPHRGGRIFAMTQWLFLAAATAFGIQSGMEKWVLPWIGWVLLRKFPCKDAVLGVQ